MRCNGNDRIPFSTKQGKGPSSQDEGGKTGLFLCCVRTLGLGSSAAGYVRELLQLPQGGQGHFRGSRRKEGFLLRRHNRKGPHLTLRGESPGFSRVAAANLGFHSSYDGDFMDPLVGPGNSSLRASCEGPLRIPLHLLLRPESSPVVEARTSAFLSSADMDLVVPLEFPQGSQASSRVETCKSALLSSWKSSVRLSVRLT